MKYEVESTEREKIKEEANYNARSKISEQSQKELGKTKSTFKPKNSPMSLQPEGGI